MVKLVSEKVGWELLEWLMCGVCRMGCRDCEVIVGMGKWVLLLWVRVNFCWEFGGIGDFVS